MINAATVQAEENGEVIRVTVTDYPNFLYMDERGFCSGYAYEYLCDIQKVTGWEYEFIRMPLEKALTAIQNDEIDLIPGNQYSEERATQMDFSKMDMGNGGTVLCVMPENNQYAYNDFADYNGMKIAALRGTVRIEQTKEKLAEYGVEAEYVLFDTDSEAKQALVDGKVDAILMSSIRCEEQYKILSRLQTTALYFCTNKEKPELKEELDKAMEEIHLTDPYYDEKLDEKYFESIQTQTSYSA